jgi:hypothetical protein
MAPKRPSGKSEPGTKRRLLSPRIALAAVFVVLAGTMDDRFADRPSDSWQMLKTAIAITETGEIGQAAGPQAPRALFRKEGDAVSRYGMGMSLVQVPAAFVAPWVEGALGPGRSGPLFLIAPLGLVLLAAWLSGRAARLLGAGKKGASVAILLTGLGSPLGSYAAWSLSEPLQAAALAGAFAGALAATKAASDRPAHLLAAASGFAAATAILAKSSLLAAAPFALLPLLAIRPRAARTGRIGAATAGFLLPGAAWLAFEVVRFGSPLTSYGGEGFTHPLLDGLWRLLIGPNKGLLFTFPAFAVALAAMAVAVRRASAPRLEDLRLLAAFAGSAVFGVLLVTSATWWAWHGVVGWGPRFLVPAIPILAAWAATLLEVSPDTLRRIFVGASVILNIPPLLVHPSLVEAYMGNMKPVPVGESDRAKWPETGLARGEGGAFLAPPGDILAEVPFAAGHVVYPWFFSLGFIGDDSALCRKLEAPPWISIRPDLGPRLVPIPPVVAREFVQPFRWRFLGRSLLEAPFRSAFEADPIYLAGLADQVVRAQATGRLERALALAEKHAELARAAGVDPLLAESLRLLRRREALAELFERVRLQGGRMKPELMVVYALWARDLGEDGTARQALSLAASSGAFAGTRLEAAAASKPAAWPPDLRSMTAPIDAPETETLRPALPSLRLTR